MIGSSGSHMMVMPLYTVVWGMMKRVKAVTKCH